MPPVRRTLAGSPRLLRLSRPAPALPCPCPALQNLGTDWDERVLPSIGNEVLKAVVAQYQASVAPTC